MSNDSDKNDLSWLQGGDDDEQKPSKPEDPGLPSWLNLPDTPEPEAEPAAEGEEEKNLPSWLDSPELSDAPAEPEPEDENVPPWMKGAAADVPPWMQGAEEPAAEEPAAEEAPIPLDQQMSEEWLSSGDALADRPDTNQNYDEWMEQKAAAARPPDLESETPDLLSDAPLPAESASGTDVPDWYLGLEELDASDAPDWLNEQQAQAAPENIELPDWLTGMEEPPRPKTGGVSGEFDDVFSAAAGGASPADETPDLDALTGGMPAAPSGEEQPDLDWLTSSAPEQTPSAEEEMPDLDFLAGSQPSAGVPSASDEEAPDLDWLTAAAPSGAPSTGEAEEETPPDLDWLAAAAPQETPSEEQMPDFAAVTGTEPAPAEEEAAPPDLDWLSSVQPAAEAPPAEPLAADASIDDVLGALGIGAPEPAMPAAGDDFFATMGVEEPPAEEEEPEAQPEEASVDWFAEAEATPEKESGSPSWLQTLEDAQPEPGAPESAEALPGSDEWLATMPDIQPATEEQSAIQSVEGFLKSLPDTGPLAEPAAPAEIVPSDYDLESLFSDQAFAPDAPAQPSQEQTLEPAMPDFLTELQKTVGEVSASAIVRQRKDRSLEDLPERLQKLHKRGEEAPPAPAVERGADPLANLLPGVTDTLAPASIKSGLPGITAATSLSDEQQSKVNMLKSLVASDVDVATARPLSAIELTYDTPYMQGLEEGEEVAGAVKPEPARAPEPAPEPAPKPKRRRARKIKVDRFFVAVLVAAAVIAPFFVSALRLGSLPAGHFAAGSAAQAAYDRVDALSQGAKVLVAVEYDPTGAAELDSLTDALLRHMILRGARPVLVGSSPVGLLHAENIIRSFNDDAVLAQRLDEKVILQPNRDYYVVRYLAGGVIGLRAFSANTTSMLLTDIRGQATGLNIQSLHDFALIVVITEQPDDLRAWAEQIEPLAGSPMVVATGFSAAPLIEPYLNANLGSAPASVQGLLVGYRDAYTYDAMLGFIPTPSGQIAVPNQTQSLPAATPVGAETLSIESLLTENPSLLESGTAPASLNPEIFQTATAAAELLNQNPSVAETITAAANLVNQQSESFGQTATAAANLLNQNPSVAETITAAANLVNQQSESIGQTATAAANLVNQQIESAGETATAAANLANQQIESAGETATAAAQLIVTTPAPTEQSATANTSPSPETAAETPGVTPTLPVLTGFIQAGQPVNLRQGPGQNTTALRSLPPNTQVQIIGQIADGSWIKIRLDDGAEGWVAASLLHINAPPTVTPSPSATQAAFISPVALLKTQLVATGREESRPYKPELARRDGILAVRFSKRQDTPTPEVTAEATETPTPTATATPSVTPTIAPSPTFPPPPPPSTPLTGGYRDERWYGMTLGIIVSAGIIAFGAIVNILRSIFKRRGRQ